MSGRKRTTRGITFDEDGNPVGFGLVDPGDATRLNFGLGLGLNDRSSLSVSYQLDRFSKTFIETAPTPETSAPTSPMRSAAA